MPDSCKNPLCDVKKLKTLLNRLGPDDQMSFACVLGKSPDEHLFVLHRTLKGKKLAEELKTSLNVAKNQKWSWGTASLRGKPAGFSKPTLVLTCERNPYPNLERQLKPYLRAHKLPVTEIAVSGGMKDTTQNGVAGPGKDAADAAREKNPTTRPVAKSVDPSKRQSQQSPKSSPPDNDIASRTKAVKSQLVSLTKQLKTLKDIDAEEVKPLIRQLRAFIKADDSQAAALVDDAETALADLADLVDEAANPHKLFDQQRLRRHFKRMGPEKPYYFAFAAGQAKTDHKFVIHKKRQGKKLFELIKKVNATNDSLDIKKRMYGRATIEGQAEGYNEPTLVLHCERQQIPNPRRKLKCWIRENRRTVKVKKVVIFDEAGNELAAEPDEPNLDVSESKQQEHGPTSEVLTADQQRDAVAAEWAQLRQLYAKKLRVAAPYQKHHLEAVFAAFEWAQNAGQYEQAAALLDGLKTVLDSVVSPEEARRWNELRRERSAFNMDVLEKRSRMHACFQGQIDALAATLENAWQAGSVESVAALLGAMKELLAGIPLQPLPEEQRAQPEVDLADARRRAKEIKRCLLDGWTEDEEGALNQIRNQSPAVVEQIRIAYQELTGHKLDDDFKKYCNEKQTSEALGLVWTSMSLLEKLEANVNEGLIWNTENEQGMLDVLRNASTADLKRAASQPEILKLLKRSLNADEIFEARKLLSVGDSREDAMFQAVVERIKAAEGVVNDDENAVWNSVLELTPKQREKLWKNHHEEFDFIDDGAEKKAFKELCLGTQAEALKKRMELATAGLGTDDDGVRLVAQKTAESLRRKSDLDDMIARGVDEHSKTLTGERGRQLKDERDCLGKIDDLVKVMRIENGEKRGQLEGGSFLEMLHSDVSSEEFQAYAAQMGVSSFERAKQQILDAVGNFDDEEEKIYKAFRATRADRDKLFKDPDVKKLLDDYLNDDERKTAKLHAEGDDYQIAYYDIGEAFRGVDTDEVGVIKLLANLPQGDLKKFSGSDLWKEMKTSDAFNKQEHAILQKLVEEGQFPQTEALAYIGKEGDGEMMELWIAKLSSKKRRAFRMGYWMKRNGKSPQTDQEKQWLNAFAAIEKMMVAQFGTDDLQKHLDALIGPPTLEEWQTKEDRQVAAAILKSRIEDKQKLQEDGIVIKGSLADGFTEADETADMAAMQFMAYYNKLSEDGEFSDNDLKVLAHLSSQYHERYDGYVATVDTVAQVAGTVAAIAAGIVVTVISGGTAGPAVGAALAKWGVAAAAAGAIAKVGVAEGMGGAHYDAMSKEGAKDALAGGVDGAMAVVAAGLAHRFTSLVGLSEKALASNMTAGALASAREGAKFAGKRLAGGGLEAAIDGCLSGIVGELVLTAADKRTWEKSIWDVAAKMGLAILKGGGIGAATGGVVGGGIAGASGLRQATKMPKALDDLKSVFSPEKLQKLTVQDVELLGRARKAIAKGNAEEADKALKELEKSLSPEEVAEVRKKLNSPADGSANEPAFTDEDIDALFDDMNVPEIRRNRGKPTIDGRRVPERQRRRLDYGDIPRRDGEGLRDALGRVGRVIDQRVAVNDSVRGAWERARTHVLNRLGDGASSLEPRELFNKVRSRFWQEARDDSGARAFFENAGFRFPQGRTTAPVLDGVADEIPIDEVRISLDHVTEVRRDGAQALDPDNLEFTFCGPNSYREIVQMRHSDLRVD